MGSTRNLLSEAVTEKEAMATIACNHHTLKKCLAKKPIPSKLNTFNYYHTILYHLHDNINIDSKQVQALQNLIKRQVLHNINSKTKFSIF